MNIKNEKLKLFIENINNDTLTIENIDKFGNEINVEGLNEFFQLIEEEYIDLFPLKVYTTVYDKEKIKELENTRKESYINAIFAAMWEKEAIGNNSKELSEAMLGFVIFGSDIIKRVRNGYELLNYNKEELNNQVYSFVEFLSDSIKNKSFFKDISQVNTQASDDVLFKSNAEEFDSIKKIKERIEVASLILNNDPDITQIFENKYKNVSMDDLSFLDDKEILVLKNKPNETNDDSLISSDDFDPFVTEYEVLNDFEQNSGFFDWIKSLVKSKNKKTSSIKLNTLRNKNKNERGFSFKVSVVLFLCIATAGLGIIAATQQSKVGENETIGEKISEENIKNKNFSIKRSGTNEVE